VDEEFTGDAGLKELAGLQQFQVLHLSGAWIDDSDLKELAGLKQLCWPDLSRTPI
jgi:hypothetical protein